MDFSIFSKYWDEGDTERTSPFTGENLTQYISRVGGYTIEYKKPDPRYFDFFQEVSPSAVIVEDEIQEEPLSFDDIVNAAQH